MLPLDVMITARTTGSRSMRWQASSIASTSPVPVVAAGGPRTESLLSALEMMVEVVKSGAQGATIGRNVWSASNPTRALLALRAVIHDQLTPIAALEKAGLGEP